MLPIVKSISRHKKQDTIRRNIHHMHHPENGIAAKALVDPSLLKHKSIKKSTFYTIIPQ
jgi:hypothetical protein